MKIWFFTSSTLRFLLGNVIFVIKIHIYNEYTSSIKDNLGQCYSIQKRFKTREAFLRNDNCRTIVAFLQLSRSLLFKVRLTFEYLWIGRFESFRLLITFLIYIKTLLIKTKEWASPLPSLMSESFFFFFLSFFFLFFFLSFFLSIFLSFFHSFFLLYLLSYFDYLFVCLFFSLSLSLSCFFLSPSLSLFLSPSSLSLFLFSLFLSHLEKYKAMWTLAIKAARQTDQVLDNLRVSFSFILNC